MTYNEQASSLWVDAARGLPAYLVSEFSFSRKVRICWCMDASSEVIQRFQFFSGNTRLKPSFLALGLLLSLQWRNNLKIPASFVQNVSFSFVYTAILRQVVGKSARENPERYCGWFWFRCSSKEFERMAREAMDVCLRVLKESNKSRFDRYSVRSSILIISHITFRDSPAHILRQPISK